MTLSNESVMAMVRDGQVEQLAILFERYHVRVFNFLLRMTGDRILSEDLTQEVFFRMLKYRHTYRESRTFTTWMFQIARNVNLDYLRKNHPEMAADDAPEPVARTVDPSDDMEKRENVVRLRQALARLPWKKRELLVLSRYHDLRYQEIADMLDCSVSAIKVGVHRALEDLRRMLWT
ncbi:MAG: RNA polymerase sigma factor [Acidobacteria bacterium]|nr:RNA polymerase sigma factor [Acidobacteriota bacterium]